MALVRLSPNSRKQGSRWIASSLELIAHMQLSLRFQQLVAAGNLDLSMKELFAVNGFVGFKRHQKLFRRVFNLQFLRYSFELDIVPGRACDIDKSSQKLLGNN